MTLQLQSWEHQLLNWAREPLLNHVPCETVQVAHSVLRTAYTHCETLTQYHSKTFFMASSLLPVEKRRAVRALYAFCRVTDNIIDEAHDTGESLARLENWRRRITSPHPADEVALAWSDTQVRYNIPLGYTRQLIEGVARDLTQTRYKTFSELAGYAYSVASTVGLMAMHIIGYGDPDAVPYAVKLGVALQLTNILRDVAEDYCNGRVYLPQEELAAFGLSESDIAAGLVDERWRAFMRFQIARNRRLYREARPGIALLAADGHFAITAASMLYEGILDDIETHDYNVFARRAHVTLVGKLRRLPIIWWTSRTIGAY